MSPGDRRVHAIDRAQRADLVRYDRAGKWYAEWHDGRTRTPLTLTEAETWAAEIIGHEQDHVIYTVPGGRTFYARLKADVGG